jgi:phosphoribosyl 1,2-cyclic phosphate phosphodiesterase
VYGPADALERMRSKFGYVFDPEVMPIPGSARPAVATRSLEPGRTTRIAGVEVLPLAFEHGPVAVFGYRFGRIAYVTDVKEVPAAARRALAGLDVLILNALWYRAHPTHLSIPEAVETARAIGARRTFLTHLTHETAHADLERDLPPDVQPAYDGLVVEVEGAVD